MFAERFDALMNIAERSNSQLGREINRNPFQIGRRISGCGKGSNKPLNPIILSDPYGPVEITRLFLCNMLKIHLFFSVNLRTIHEREFVLRFRYSRGGPLRGPVIRERGKLWKKSLN